MFGFTMNIGERFYFILFVVSCKGQLCTVSRIALMLLFYYYLFIFKKPLLMIFASKKYRYDRSESLCFRIIVPHMICFKTSIFFSSHNNVNNDTEFLVALHRIVPKGRNVNKTILLIILISIIHQCRI